MPSYLSSVRAQETAVTTLRRALENDRVHHAYLFDGPDGVGKERAAFGLAQALVCEARKGSDACGECSACVRAIPQEGEILAKHPDVVVIGRGVYDPAQIGRRTPETSEISIDQVRTLVLSRAAYAPHEGRARVFILRHADELSTSAANALLKTLEEPTNRTHFILFTSHPDTLLQTIRSRTQRVRFGPLPEEVVKEILMAKGVDAKRAKEVAPLSRGSASAALSLSDVDESAEREAFVNKVIAAVDAPGMGPALALAEDTKKMKAGLPAHLSALLLDISLRAREAAQREDAEADRLAKRFTHVITALSSLERNGSAQLVMETMLSRMRA